MKTIFAILTGLMLLFIAACNVPPAVVSTAAPTGLPALPGGSTAPAATQVPTLLPTQQPTLAPSATSAATAAPTGVPNVPAIPVATSVPVQQVTSVVVVTVPPLDGEEFALRLVQAIEGKDFVTLRSMMNPRTSIVTFNKSLFEYDSQTALDMFRNQYLTSESQPAARWGTDTTALLGGSDPLGQWGPIANVVRVIHVMGLSPLTDSEALIAIGRDNATGKFYWHGVILPENGRYFAGLQPVGDALPTDVKMIQALDALRVRTGPGFNYAVEGMLREGETAQVSGKSADGNWWQIFCVQDASGRCWVSADPTLSLPIGLP